MAVPKYQEFTLPLIKLLKEHGELSNGDLRELMIHEIDIYPEDLEEKLPAGKNKFIDRIDWAKSVLKEAELIYRPYNGCWSLTQKGKELVLDKIEVIDNNFLKSLRGTYSLEKEKSVDNETLISVLDDKTPEEQISDAFFIIRKSLKAELLEKIKRNSPKFFEQLVVDLLVAMGYGGSHQDAAQAIGKTSDGGIDGIISEDRLGLDKIYIQAKRWENTVGRPDIQQFKGALADQVAKKGVFITTSSFSKEAIESAKKSGIVLIDGDKLTSLMIEFGLGVQIERSFHIYKIDQDRFDEDNF